MFAAAGLLPVSAFTAGECTSRGYNQAMALARSLALLVLFAASAGAQVDPNTALLERAGWDALNQGNARTATAAFRDALRADPNNGRLHLGAALAAFLDKRDEHARDEATRALAINPKLTQAREVLAHALHRLGDLSGALRAYEEFAAEKTDNAFRDTLERWRREVELHDRMRETIGSHFSVAFEGPAEADLAQEALQSLDRAYWRIAQLLGTYPPEPVSVVLYSTRQFADITRSPAWAAGAFDGVIRVPMRGALGQPSELDRVLAHEFTHALVRTLAPRGVPAWLNEGLATALETEGRSSAERRVEAQHANASLADLPQSFAALNGDEAAAAYAASAAAVRRLLDDQGGVAIANLLRDVGDGADFEDAFLHRFFRPFSAFQASR
jgi:tetratricopeptide (TPR) repeat protein